MLESIITDYLRQNRRLVIPELGAFLRKESGEVVFAPFLNKDDGILTGLVRQNYGASTTEAEGIIGKYVNTVEEAVESKGAYLLSPLGSLKKDPNGLLFLDAADLNPQPVPQPQEPAAEKSFDPEPEIPVETESVVSIQPDPVPLAGGPEPELPAEPVHTEWTEPRTVAETADAPKTINDLIRERQEEQEPAPTVHSRMAEPEKKPASPRKPVAPPAPAVQRKPAAPPARKEKRGDLILILAVVVAIIAVAAMIYAYAVVDLPLFNLQ